MAQNSQPLDLEEALQRLYDAMPTIERVESLALARARGRILATTVTAPLALPPFRASAMDGYAVRSTDFASDAGSEFSILGESLAGHPFSGTVGAGECVRVFTGAKVPDGADQVLLQEEVATLGERTVSFNPHEPAEPFVRPVGHDVNRGAALAEAGDRLGPFALGALAAAGVDRVDVLGLPCVGVFSTGDELVDPGTPPDELREGQIYDSNRFTVLNLLHDAPCTLEDLGRLPDEPTAVAQAFSSAAARCDIMLTSGGVSVGDADFVTSTIAKLGALEFWRLNLKPGKPLAFGRIGDCRVFGLPGNPVSTIVTLLLLAKPAILHCAGAAPAPLLRVSATLASPVSHSPGRAEYQRGRYTIEQGELRVETTGDQSSNRLQTFRGANCLIEVPKSAGDLPAGEQIEILPFNGLLG